MSSGGAKVVIWRFLLAIWSFHWASVDDADVLRHICNETSQSKWVRRLWLRESFNGCYLLTHSRQPIRGFPGVFVPLGLELLLYQFRSPTQALLGSLHNYQWGDRWISKVCWLRWFETLLLTLCKWRSDVITYRMRWRLSSSLLQ